METLPMRDRGRQSRRRFILATGGILAAAAGGGWGIASAAPKRHTIRKEGFALGSKSVITALHEDPAIAQQALDAAFAELDLIEDIMSLYRPGSQVSRLNQSGKISGPHPYLVKVLAYARTISEATEGAFDITVQPLWTAHAEAKKQGSLPDSAAITAARERIDWRQVEVSDREVSLTKPGGAITLNGIAQGFAADQVASILKAHGVEHALIDTGELEALGTSPEASPWKVGIQHPRVPEGFISLAAISGRCLATSGDYETAFTADFTHHHIFNPKTGQSAQEFSSVSVAAETAMEADALSTALFVLGQDRGIALIEQSFPGADALLVLQDGKVRATKGFPFAA